MAPRTPYAQAAGRILSKRLVGGSLPSFGLSVAFLLQLFQLTPARVLQLDAFSGVSWAWLWTTLSAVLATAPAFILLKNAKSASKCIPQSPVALATGNLVSLRFLGGALFYALSATWVITIYLNFMFPSLAEGVYYYPDGPRLPAQLSERHLITRLFAGFVGLCYAVEWVARDRDFLRFPAIQKLNAKKAGIPIFSTIVEAMLTVLGYELVFITLYLLFGQFVYSVYWTSCDAFLGLIVNLRYDASSYDSLLSPPYLLALLLGATLALTCWELASKIFDRDFSVAISASSLHNVATLLTGLSKDNSSFIRYLAFLELQRTVRYSPDARGDVFGDLDPAGGKWGRIRSECLGVIEEAAVAAEGVLETSKPKSKGVIGAIPSKTTRTIPTRPGSATSPIRQIQLKPLPATPPPKQQKSILSRVLGAGTEAFTPRKAPMDPRSPTVAVPSILRSEGSLPVPDDAGRTPPGGSAASTAAPSKPPPSLSEKFLAWIMATPMMKSEFMKPFVGSGERYARLSAVSKSQLVVLAVRSLCDLVAASRTEDPYGRVQRDVPSILDSLLRLHDAMSKLSSSNPDNDIAIEAKTVAEASKSGIQMVANAFYADLRLLDLSSKTREAMQGFVDMAR